MNREISQDKSKPFNINNQTAIKGLSMKRVGTFVHRAICAKTKTINIEGVTFKNTLLFLKYMTQIIKTNQFLNIKVKNINVADDLNLPKLTKNKDFMTKFINTLNEFETAIQNSNIINLCFNDIYSKSLNSISAHIERNSILNRVIRGCQLNSTIKFLDVSNNKGLLNNTILLAMNNLLKNNRHLKYFYFQQCGNVSFNNGLTLQDNWKVYRNAIVCMKGDGFVGSRDLIHKKSLQDPMMTFLLALKRTEEKTKTSLPSSIKAKISRMALANLKNK